MPAAAAGAVIAIGGSAATAAVTAAVVKGVVIGAVVGAATSLVSGGNVLKGALKGAAIGGIGAGLVSGAGIATGMSSASSQLGNLGVSLPGAEIAQGTASTTGLGAGMSSLGGDPSLATAAGGTETATNVGLLAEGGASGAGATQEAGSGFLEGMSDGTKQIIAGVGEGMAKGAGDFLSAKEKSKSDLALLEQKRQWELEDRRLNMPGQFEARVAKATNPDWWMTHLDPTAANKYLVGGTNGEAATAQG